VTWITQYAAQYLAPIVKSSNCVRSSGRYITKHAQNTPSNKSTSSLHMSETPPPTLPPIYLHSTHVSYNTQPSLYTSLLHAQNPPCHLSASPKHMSKTHPPTLPHHKSTLPQHVSKTHTHTHPHTPTFPPTNLPPLYTFLKQNHLPFHPHPISLPSSHISSSSNTSNKTPLHGFVHKTHPLFIYTTNRWLLLLSSAH